MAAATEAKAKRENRDSKGRYWYVADSHVKALSMVREAAEDIFDQRGGCRAGKPGSIVSFDWGVLSTEDARVVKWLESHPNYNEKDWREPVGFPARAFRPADEQTLAIILGLEKKGVPRKLWHVRINTIRRAYDATESIGE